MIGANYIRKQNIKNHTSGFKFYLTKAQAWAYLVFGFIFFVIMYASMFSGYTKTKGAGYSDLPFHLNIISSFTMGCNNKRTGFFRVLTAFFAKEPLVYPFIPNFHCALLVSTGYTSIRHALLYPALFITYSLLMSIYSLSYYFTKSHFASIVSVILFTNLGGLGWTHLHDPRHRNDPRRDWIHDWGNNQMEYWFHPIMHIMIPQRSALWAMPLAYWAILCLMIGVEHGDWKMFALAGLLTGFLPQLQVHSYVSVAQYAVILCILTFHYNFKTKEWKKDLILWTIYAIVANVIAFPQLPPYFHRVGNARHEFLMYNPIWKSSQYSKRRFVPIILWWRGLGIFAAIALVFGYAEATKRQIIFYIPALFVFVTTNIIRYQPWELDNTKLFYAAWIPVALPFVSQYLCALVKRPKNVISQILGFGIFIIFLVGCCLSAYMSTVQSLFWPTGIFGTRDYKFGLWVAENTPPKSIFIFESMPGNVIDCIAGRQVFYGYGGWVSSHGLDFGRKRIENDLLRNPNNIQGFKEQGVSYVVNSRENIKFKPAKDNKHWTKVCKYDRYELYKLNE